MASRSWNKKGRGSAADRPDNEIGSSPTKHSLQTLSKSPIAAVCRKSFPPRSRAMAQWTQSMNRPESDDRKTFWPRVGPVGFVPDLGDDRPCANCGYNLRGLAYDSACPECGALFGINPACDQIPWDDADRRGVGGFVAA